MKRLYFIRHGLSEANKLGIFSGTSETPLSPEGRKQAKLAGQKAKDLSIDYIVTSPLERAVETAIIIAKEIGYPKSKIHLNPLFIERHYGELEGKAWSPDLNLDGISDIETVDTILERAKLALNFLESLDTNHILVVSHGGFGRALRSLVLTEQTFGNKTNRHNAIDKIPNAEIIQWL